MAPDTPPQFVADDAGGQSDDRLALLRRHDSVQKELGYRPRAAWVCASVGTYNITRPRRRNMEATFVGRAPGILRILGVGCYSRREIRDGARENGEKLEAVPAYTRQKDACMCVFAYDMRSASRWWSV